MGNEKSRGNPCKKTIYLTPSGHRGKISNFSLIRTQTPENIRPLGVN